MTMCAKRILLTCHTIRIMYLHCSCQMHLHYNPALWHRKHMDVKRKPAQTTAPAPSPGVLFILRYLQLLPAPQQERKAA